MTHVLANLNQPAVSPTYFPGSKGTPLMLGRLRPIKRYMVNKFH